MSVSNMDVYVRVFILFTGLITCYGQRCDDNQLRRCREDTRRRSDRAHDLSTSDCRTLREDFDCLLDQTVLCISRESEKEDYGNDIIEAHSTLRRYCNRKEGWNTNSCYEKDSIFQCEDNLPKRLLDADSESCRKYQDFKDCVERIVDNQCSRSDRSYLRSHYIDVARDLPWKCSISTSVSYSGRHPTDDYDNNYKNRSRNEQTCCKYERCEDRDRSINCREDLIRFISGRSNIQSHGNNQELCRSALNSFNCMLWHTYNCQENYEKDSKTLRDGKEFVERNCDTAGDIRRKDCYNEPIMKDCDRHLSEESQSPHDVTCSEYLSFVGCVERQLGRCSSQDELLQGIYVVNKVGEKAWTCSKRDTGNTKYPPYTGSYGGPYSTGGSIIDDYNCEVQSRREHRRCLAERDRLNDDARRETNHREKHVKSCCVAYQFRECTRQVVRQICQRERSAVVDNLMGHDMITRMHECQDVEQSTCSASIMLNNAIFILLAVAIFRSIFSQE